jgi:hypothetical protein
MCAGANVCTIEGGRAKGAQNHQQQQSQDPNLLPND